MMAEAVCKAFVDHFKGVENPRIDRHKLHNLQEIIVIAICASVAECNGFEEIAMFAESHEEWFRKFLKLENGFPSYDTFKHVFTRINPRQFRASFASGTRAIAGFFAEVVAIDGKTYKGAKLRDESKSSSHMLSAWACNLRLVLAQEKFDEKSNKITAIPEILKMLTLKGCIVTIDTVGCQQKIAEQITQQGGEYFLCLKENQKNTVEAVTEHYSVMPEKHLFSVVEYDKGHGRIETRKCFTADAKKVANLKNWSEFKSVVTIISKRNIGNRKSEEVRFDLSSVPVKEAQKFAGTIGALWDKENSLHYVLYITFDQDRSRVANDAGPEKLAVLRHFAINILKHAPNASKSIPSANLNRKKAAMSRAYLEKIMTSVTLVAARN